MLDYAYFHQGELYDCLRETLKNKDLYFYFMFPSKFFSFRIFENDKDVIQFVSISPDGTVIGLFSAYVDHENECIDNLDFINFTGTLNFVFSWDMKCFFDELFLNRNFRKVKFHGILKNPATEGYRKIIKKLNGREVGILKEQKRLTDGKYYDEIIFELYRDGYLNAIKTLKK